MLFVVNINNYAVIASSTHLSGKLWIGRMKPKVMLSVHRIMDHGFLGVLRDSPGLRDWDRMSQTQR